MTRRVSIATLLLVALAAMSAPPGKPAATNAPAPAPSVPAQVIRNWNFSLQKDGHTQGRFHGDSARIVAPRVFDVESLKAETFRSDGENDLTAESPACRVTVTSNETFVVTSPGTLKLSQAGERFGLTGEGFLWDHGAQRLIVSNKVESFLLISLPRISPAPGR